MTFSAMLLLAVAEITLPIAEVKEVADYKQSVYPGRVVPIAKVEVIPQVSGEILEVCFKNGQIVKAGDVLYRLDPVKYEAAVKNAQSKLTEMKANVKYAELSYERHKNLMETRAVSLDAVDNALSQRDSTRAAYAAAQADLVAAQDDLKHCTIIAPIDGKIGSTTKTKGNYVTTGSDPLVTLVQLSPIRVKFAISNREVLDLMGTEGRKRPEDIKIALTLANGTRHSDEGAIEYTENEADGATDTLTVYSLFQNEQMTLLPGGTVAIELSSKRGVMRPAISPMAVLQDTQGPYVWVLDANGIVSRRTIARGDIAEGWMFVEKGLKVGERIVADGGHRVRKGMKVTAAK